MEITIIYGYFETTNFRIQNKTVSEGCAQLTHKPVEYTPTYHALKCEILSKPQ